LRIEALRYDDVEARAPAVEAVFETVLSGQFGTMAAYVPPDIVAVSLADVVGKTKTVPPDSDIVRTARALSVSFGD